MRYKTVQIDNVSIFYREAGESNKETILFLHGFPASSHMYRDVMRLLCAKYHVIAPDYPGFGYSSTLPPDQFEYSFDNMAVVMERFLLALRLERFHLYMQDYGGPIGFRIAVKHPEWIQSLLIQNANAYTDGLGPYVQKMGALERAGDAAALDEAIREMLSLEGIKEQYMLGVANPERVSPDGYMMDHFFMERPGVRQIQSTLFRNYGTNFPKYPEWQHYFSKHQPPALITWGKNDEIFTAPGGKAYLRDLPQAELHLLEGSHFVLEEKADDIAGLIDRFLQGLR